MKFYNWCLKNASHLDIKVTQLNWIQSFFPEYYDFSVDIFVDGVNYQGVGFDRDQDTAITKAIAEAIERTVVTNNILTSNGIAAHVLLKNAKQNAKSEIVERDLFLNHFHTSTPFIRIPAEEFQIPLNLKKYIEDNDDQIKIYRTKKSNLGTTLITVISNQKHWGGIISTHLSQNSLNLDIFKSLINAVRHYRFERSQGQFKSKISLEHFNSLSKHNFQDHQNLALDVDYFKKINFLFTESTEYENENIEYSENDFVFHSIDLVGILKKCPLHIVKCENLTTIPLQTGYLIKDSISTLAIKRFLHEKDYKINKLPHPLG